MNPVKRSFWILCVLLLQNCGAPRDSAEIAIADVEAAYESLREEAINVAPADAQAIESEIAVARECLAKKDFKTAMAKSEALQPRLTELYDRLPTMRSALETTWETLSASLPGTLASLRRDFDRSRRPLAGPRRAVFDSSATAVHDLVDDWAGAREVMKEGKLAEAVNKAEDVKNRALELIAAGNPGS